MNQTLLRCGLATLAVLAAAPTAVVAQTTNPRPAPQWLLNALDLNQGTIQDLQIPTERRTFQFRVELGGRLVTAELEPNDIRSPDFELLVDDGNSITKVPTPDSVTFIGRVLGLPESRVAGSVVEGRLRATISLDEHDHELWGIEAVREFDLTAGATEHVVYTTHDANVPGISCGTDHTHWQSTGGSSAESSVLKLAEIAIDCDLEYYQRNGSNVTTTQNAVTALMNAIDAIYQRDLEIQYTVTTILVRTVRTYTNTDMGNLLGEFQNRWNSQHGSIQRDVAHLFTGKGSFSGVVGIAYLGVICNLGSAYGVDKAFSSFATNVGLICHEAGHNWNAPHCNSSNPCNIMCSGLGGCSRTLNSFAPVSINTIVNFKNSRSCLSNAVFPPTLSTISPNSTSVAPRQLVTLTGNNFNGVTAVNIAGQQVNAVVQSNTQLVFTPPLPPTLGSYPVSVTNSAGTSNVLLLSYTASPGFYNVTNQSFRGGSVSFSFAGAPTDIWLLRAGFAGNATFPFLGFDILQSGIMVTQGALDQIGLGSLLYNVPANINMAGVVMYSQIIEVDQTSPVLNYVSTPRQTIFLF
jgi:hypothetical protein